MKINILPKDDKTNGWSALLAERKPKAHLKGDVYADWVVLGAGYVVPHVAPDGPLRKNGRLAPPDVPGLGISPDPDILGAPDLVLE